MNNNRIKTWQLSMLLALIIHGAFFGVINSAFLDLTKQDILLVLLAALTLSLLITLGYYRLWKMESNSVFIKIKEITGKIVGRVIIAALISLFFFLFVITLYNVVDFVAIIYLPHTPFIIIALLLAFTIAYAINAGLESIIRLAPYILSFSLMSFVFLLLSGTQMQYNNFLPMSFSFSVDKIQAILLLSAVIVLPEMFALFIAPKSLIDQRRFLPGLLIGTIGGYLLISLDTIFTIGFLGIELANIYKHPEFYVLKKIQLFSFFKNIEILLSIRWILDALIVMIVSVKMIKRGLLALLPLNKLSERKLALIIALTGVVIVGAIFGPGAEKYFYLKNGYGIAVVSVIVLMVMTLFIMRLVNKKVVKR